MHYRFSQHPVQPADAARQITEDSKLARHTLFQAIQAFERHGDEWQDHFAKGDCYGEPMALLLTAAEQLDGWLLELIRVVEQNHEQRQLTEIRHTITSAAG
jgi:hypothetical protein